MRVTILNGFINQVRNIPLIVWLIILASFIIRVLGINYGLPLYLNMDEPVAVSSTLLLKHSLNPDHFDWPHLYFYTLAGFYGVIVIIKFLVSSLVELPAYFYTAEIYFLSGRLFNAILSSITVILVFLLTKIAFNQKAAIIAASIIAFLPVHVYESHFVKPDIYQTLLVTACMYFIYRIYEQKDVMIQDYIYSGIFIGLSTSIKYGGVLVFFPMVTAILLNSKMTKEDCIKKAKYTIVSGLTSILFFYLGTPFAIKEFQKFFSYERGVGALWQIQNVGSIPIEQYPLEVYETFSSMYLESLGVGLWAVFLVGTLLFLFFNKRDHKTLIFFMPALFLSIYISRFKRSPQHYFLFLIPMYVPFLANFLVDMSNYLYALIIKALRPITLRMEISPRVRNYVISLAIFLVLIPSIYSSVMISTILSREDTRTMAYKWIVSNLDNETDRLYVYGSPLDSVVFDFKHVEKLKKLDVSDVEPLFPLYILVGVEDVKTSEILEGNRDPETIKGNSEALLKEAELVFSADDDNRLGPPIYIFKVKHFFNTKD